MRVRVFMAWARGFAAMRPRILTALLLIFTAMGLLVSGMLRECMGLSSDCEFQMIRGIYHKSRGVKGATEKKFLRALWREQRAAVMAEAAKIPGAVIPCGWKTRKRSDYVFLRYGIQSL